MSFFSKIFSKDDEEFKEVRVDREVLDSVIYYSQKAYPNEFLAFFDGEIKDKILYITSLIFLPGETGLTGAVIHTEMLPSSMKYWGTVHSHPGPSAEPSGADLKTFSKHGYFHMIVCLPYCLESFKAYNRYGNPQKYTLGDYSYMLEDNSDEFFDENDVLNDDDEFKPGFLDEKDDEFFIDDENEFTDNHSSFENQNEIVIDLSDLSQGVLEIQIDENGNVKKIKKE